MWPTDIVSALARAERDPAFRDALSRDPVATFNRLGVIMSDAAKVALIATDWSKPEQEIVQQLAGVLSEWGGQIIPPSPNNNLWESRFSVLVDDDSHAKLTEFEVEWMRPLAAMLQVDPACDSTLVLRKIDELRHYVFITEWTDLTDAEALLGPNYAAFMAAHRLAGIATIIDPVTVFELNSEVVAPDTPPAMQPYFVSEVWSADIDSVGFAIYAYERAQAMIEIDATLHYGFLAGVTSGSNQGALYNVMYVSQSAATWQTLTQSAALQKWDARHPSMLYASKPPVTAYQDARVYQVRPGAR